MILISSVYNQLCVLFFNYLYCIVQFDDKPSVINKWGYNFDELVEKLDKTIETTPAANQPYILITHV